MAKKKMPAACNSHSPGVHDGISPLLNRIAKYIGMKNLKCWKDLPKNNIVEKVSAQRKVKQRRRPKTRRVNQRRRLRRKKKQQPKSKPTAISDTQKTQIIIDAQNQSIQEVIEASVSTVPSAPPPVVTPRKQDKNKNKNKTKGKKQLGGIRLTPTPREVNALNTPTIVTPRYEVSYPATVFFNTTLHNSVCFPCCLVGWTVCQRTTPRRKEILRGFRLPPER